jgi:hypothetical protein
VPEVTLSWLVDSEIKWLNINSAALTCGCSTWMDQSVCLVFPLPFPGEMAPSWLRERWQLKDKGDTEGRLWNLPGLSHLSVFVLTLRQILPKPTVLLFYQLQCLGLFNHNPTTFCAWLGAGCFIVWCCLLVM